MVENRIVVVCTANMIRSPFVAGLLSTRLVSVAGGALRVESAGTAARAGDPAAPQVVELGRTYGVDLGEHRTRRLDEGVLQTGDVVLCAERAHRRVVLDLRPDLISTVFTVREFARLVNAPGVRAGASDWRSLVRVAARARLATGVAGDHVDDITDPVGGPTAVWTQFERQASHAVSSILGALTDMSFEEPRQAWSPRLPPTRREYRSQLTVPPTRRAARRS